MAKKKSIVGSPSVGPIEENVPLPRSKRWVGLREPMSKLRAAKPGGIPRDSFVTSASKNGCYGMATVLGIRINIRKEGEDTIRVWRVDEEAE